MLFPHCRIWPFYEDTKTFASFKVFYFLYNTITVSSKLFVQIKIQYILFALNVHKWDTIIVKFRYGHI